MISLIGTEDPHLYCGYASWVLMIFLIGGGGPNGNYVSSFVLKIGYTGCNSSEIEGSTEGPIEQH